MFDYEFAVQQHNIGCRLARRVITPDAIPPSRLARFGATGDKLLQYPGLKEEYYLADFEPDPTILDRLGVDARPRRRRGPAAARRLALPPQVQPAVPARAQTTSATATTSRRWFSRGPRPSASTCGSWDSRSVIVRRGSRRRAEPDRSLRPRGLGRRQHEPRGGGARRARLHDLRRSSGRRRRVADPLGPPATTDRSARAGAGQADARRSTGRAAIPACWST